MALESYRPEPPVTDVDIAEVIRATRPRDLFRGRHWRPRIGMHHYVIHLDRFGPGISYNEQALRIFHAAEALSTEETARLVVDATGVGRAAVDMLYNLCRHTSPRQRAISNCLIPAHPG